MKKKYSFLAFVFIFLNQSIFAGTFTSRSNGGGAWTGKAAVWIIVGDADGVIDTDDDVTIMGGDVITWGTANIQCRNLTVAGTIQGLSGTRVAYIYGNYNVSGTETGAGTMLMLGGSKTITVTGTVGLANPKWSISNTHTILFPSVITKTSIGIGANSVLTNQGTVTVTTMNVPYVTSTWINAAGSSLTINQAGFMSGRTFTANAAGNTVTLAYTSGAVPTTTAGFYNLILAGVVAGAKTLPSATVVANNLTINATNTLNSNGFDLTVGGNWSNAGVFTAGARTVTFNGTSTVSGTSTTSFNNVTITGILTGHATNMNVAGNWVNGGTYNHNSGRVTFNGTTTVSGASTTGFNNVTISGTLTGHATSMNVAGNWINNGTYTHNNGIIVFNGTTTVSGASATSFDNVSITGTLTGHATSMNIAGNWTNAGAYIHNNGTIVFNGTTAVSGASTTSFNNVTITGTLTGHATSMNVVGNWANAGTYTHNSGTVIFNGTTTVSGASATTFNNVTITGILTGHATNMNLKGNYVNNGTFNNNSGTLTFNGIAVQTISGASSTTFENLTINNTAGAGTGVSITGGIYTLDGGLTMSNGTLSTGGNSFTMTSTLGKTAYIAQITGTGAIAGNFVIETFLRGGAATWLDISAPVAGTTFGEWVATGLFPAISYSYSPPYNAYPTQYTYDNGADDWPVATAGTTVSTGVEVYLSGNYSYGAFAGALPTSTGVPTQGDQAIPVGAGDNLVGNPFACSISWAAVAAASPGVTGFDIMSGGSYVAGGAEIPAGQGFWVYGAGTLNIPESAKTTTSNGNVASVVADPYFTLKLSSDEYNVPFTHILKIAASSDASDGWSIDEDHLYRKTPVKNAPSLYTSVDDKNLIINKFNNSNETYSMPVMLKIGVAGNYKFEAININRMTDYTYIKLEDKLLNKMIDLRKQDIYSFNVNAIGDDIDRFVLHFSKTEDIEILTNINKISDFTDHVEILPSVQGNIINFYLGETTSATITATNVIGQTIIDPITMDANNQSVTISLPEEYHGMYILTIQ